MFKVGLKTENSFFLCGRSGLCVRTRPAFRTQATTGWMISGSTTPVSFCSSPP